MASDELTWQAALHNAHQSLVDGPGDPRSIEGVKVNALQSIAWSLMGLLARDQAAAGRDEEQSIAQIVERALGSYEIHR